MLAQEPIRFSQLMQVIIKSVTIVHNVLHSVRLETQRNEKHLIMVRATVPNPYVAMIEQASLRLVQYANRKFKRLNR